MSTGKHLIQWYRLNQRSLPWRETRDPYCIWVSEVILQQTRVDQGLEYYHRFINKYPDVKTLAMANQEAVLRLWQGLGYYSRARNMHSAARQVMERHQGHFPTDYESLIQLKGIGEYTAAAIASISASEKHAVIDGNVIRVISRLYAILEDPKRKATRDNIRRKMENLMNSHEPGEFNQAVMEFGALQCIPRSPDCLSCPLKDGCLAFKQQLVHELPLKIKKQKPQNRFLNFLVFHHPENPEAFYFYKMPPGGIWQGLYVFPFIESSDNVTMEQLASHPEMRNMNAGFHSPEYLTEMDHILSHQKIKARFYALEVKDPDWVQQLNNYHRVRRQDLDDIPLPRLMLKFLETN